MTDTRDTISRNAGFAFASKAVGAVCTATLTIVLVRVLGPEKYGVFTLAMSIGGLVFLPGDIGIAQAAARFVAEAAGDRSVVSAVISDAVRAKLIAAGCVSVLLAVLAGPIANAYDAPSLEWPLRILAISLFAESFLLLYNALLQALGRISVYLRIVTLESISEASLSVAIVLLGGGAAGAMAGRAAAYIFAAVYGSILIGRTAGRRISVRRGSGGGNLKRIFGYGSALLVIDGAITLFYRLDAILIGAIVSIPAVGRFEAAGQLAGFLGYGGQSIGAAIAPRMARTEDEAPDVPLFERGLRIVMLVQGIFIAPLVVWAGPITNLILGPGYGESAEVLRVMAPFAFLVGISPMVSLSVNYLGEARRRIFVAIAALTINVTIDLLLLGKIGMVAAAIGTDVAYTFYVIMHLRILRRMVDIRLRPVASVFLRVLAAAAVVAAVLFALGTGDVPLAILLVGAIVGPAAYVAALLALRAVDVDELKWGWRRARAALPGSAAR